MLNSSAITEREAAVDSADFSYVRERLISEAKLVGEDLYAIDREFKRFLKLVLYGQRPLAMIDRRVDEYWHMLVLFTPQYREFCSRVMGFFVDHQPRTSLTPVPASAIANFVEEYRGKYGRLEEFWLEKLTPELRTMIEANRIPEDLSFQWSGWTGPQGKLEAHF